MPLKIYFFKTRNKKHIPKHINKLSTYHDYDSILPDYILIYIYIYIYIYFHDYYIVKHKEDP